VLPGARAEGPPDVPRDVEAVPRARSRRPGALIALIVAVAACSSATSTDAPHTSAQLSSAPSGPALTSTATRPEASPTSAAPSLRAVTVEWQLPEARSRAVAFADGASILLAGGLTSAGTTGSILEITIASGEVTPIGELQAPVHDAGGALIAGAPAVVGGGHTAPGAAVQGIRDGTVTLLGELPHARADLSVVDLDAMTYVVGGGTTTRRDPAVLGTSDGATFVVVARLPVPVRYAAVAVVGRSIIVVGGTDGSSDRTEIQSIDPVSGSARVIGHLPAGLSHAAALVIERRLLILGGRSRGHPTDQVLEIDPNAGTATAVGHLPRAASDVAAVVIDGVGYLIGGEDANLLRSVISITLD
jgi:hypothetical protein